MFTNIFAHLLSNRDFVMAVIIVSVSSIVLLAYRSANPEQMAEHYYRNENENMYRVMQICYIVIIASIGFNVRFILFEAVSAAATAATR